MISLIKILQEIQVLRPLNFVKGKKYTFKSKKTGIAFRKIFKGKFGKIFIFDNIGLYQGMGNVQWHEVELRDYDITLAKDD